MQCVIKIHIIVFKAVLFSLVIYVPSAFQVSTCSAGDSAPYQRTTDFSDDIVIVAYVSFLLAIFSSSIIFSVTINYVISLTFQSI